jgi:Fur family transcriptional regulator, ferric uptake regulator
MESRVTESVQGMTRFTRQRVQMLELLSDSAGFLTPHQLHQQLRTRGAKVGLTTVYRTLQVLQHAGEIDAMRLPTGEQLYRRCGDAHHHHLVCRVCSATVEVRSAAVERWATAKGTEHGFTDVSHTVEIFGLCSRCARRRLGT